MIRLKSLLTEADVFYDKIPTEFDSAVKELDDQMAEQTRVYKQQKKGIAAVKKEWPKIHKMIEDWNWGKSKMGHDEYTKAISAYEKRLQSVGVLSDYGRIST